jgi:hypothetical protein
MHQYINKSNVFIKPFLHQPMSQSAIQKPSLKPQTTSNADVYLFTVGLSISIKSTICITICYIFLCLNISILYISISTVSIYCLCVTDVSVCIEHWCLARGVQYNTCSSPVMLWHNVLQYQKVPSCNRMTVKGLFPLANPGLRNKNINFLVYLCFVHTY